MRAANPNPNPKPKPNPNPKPDPDPTPKQDGDDVCETAEDVECIMPDNCAQDKCLLECAYNTGCEAVWRRRGWTSHPKAVALRSAAASAGATPAAAASRRDGARGAAVRRLNPRRNLVKVF